METIDKLTNTGNQEQLLEKGHDLVLYTFDEYGRLEHYARITASTPEAHAYGHRCVSLTLYRGGEDMRRFHERDMGVFRGLPDALEQLREQWAGRSIWWERDGSIPGVEDGVTFDGLRGGWLLARLREDVVSNMRVRGVEAGGGQAEKDERTLEKAGRKTRVPSLFDMFEEYVVAGVDRMLDAGVERELTSSPRLKPGDSSHR